MALTKYRKRFLCSVIAVLTILPLSAPAQIAMADMQQVAQALDLCALDTGYYVSPEALNDTSNPASTPAYNYIADQGGTFVLRPSEGIFLANRVNLATAPLPWNGPYLNYQQGRTQTTSGPYDLGSPIDPWGNPYLLYSPVGLLRGDSGMVTLDYYADMFDRYTLVSLGPDSTFGTDDITYVFGPSVTSTRLSSVRTSNGQLTGSADGTSFSLTAGSTMILRGINLGSQSGAQLTWGSTPLTSISGWTSREITVTLPQNIQGTAPLFIRRGSANTNALQLTINSLVTAVTDWRLYE